MARSERDCARIVLEIMEEINAMDAPLDFMELLANSSAQSLAKCSGSAMPDSMVQVVRCAIRVMI